MGDLFSSGKKKPKQPTSCPKGKYLTNGTCCDKNTFYSSKSKSCCPQVTSLTKTSCCPDQNSQKNVNGTYYCCPPGTTFDWDENGAVCESNDHTKEKEECEAKGQQFIFSPLYNRSFCYPKGYTFYKNTDTLDPYWCPTGVATVPNPYYDAQGNVTNDMHCCQENEIVDNNICCPKGRKGKYQVKQNGEPEVICCQDNPKPGFGIPRCCPKGKQFTNGICCDIGHVGNPQADSCCEKGEIYNSTKQMCEKPN